MIPYILIALIGGFAIGYECGNLAGWKAATKAVEQMPRPKLVEHETRKLGDL